MNRVLYLLIGGSVAGMIALAFLQQQDIGRASSRDALAVFGFCLAAATTVCLLIYSRRGRQLRLRLEQKEIDEDDRTRTNARAKGEVRPPLGS